MRILSSRRTRIFPDSVDLSLTTTVTFVRSKSAVRLWKSAACVSSCLRTFSSVPLFCCDGLRPANVENVVLAAAAHSKTAVLTTPDTLIQSTSPLIRVEQTDSTVVRIQNRAAILPHCLRCYRRFPGYAFHEAAASRAHSTSSLNRLMVSFCMIAILCSTANIFAFV